MSMPVKRSPPRLTNMPSQSHDSDEEGVTPPGSAKEIRSLSRNAQAQARLRARRKAYVDSLEANVKRLQTIVDAIALNPNRAHATASPSASSPHQPSPFNSSPETFSSDPSTGLQQPPGSLVHQLQVDNARLRRERDALQVQIDALIGYISRGYSLPSDSGTAASSIDHGVSPNPGSDVEIEPHAPVVGSPLIQGDIFNQDQLNQFLSMNEHNLLMSYLNLQTPGPSDLQVPRPSNTSGSSPATFDSLSAAGTQTEPADNFLQGTHSISRSSLMFHGGQP